MEEESPPREIEPVAMAQQPPPAPFAEPGLPLAPPAGAPPPELSSLLIEPAALPVPEWVPEPPPPPPPVVPPPRPLACLLAGIESGVLGAAVMIGWFALDSVLERQYWWAMMNLWGAGVYHNRTFTMGFGIATVVGASFHFFLHGVGGALWSLAAGRMNNFWLHLGGSFAAAAGWYLVLMHGFWPVVAPVVSRITPVPATFLAYLLFGAAISRNAHRARQLDAFWET